MKWIFSFAVLFLFSCAENHTESNPEKLDTQKITPVLKKGAVNPYAPVDVSPMDMAYFPTDYPVKKMSNAEAQPPLARVIYSRPQKQGRPVFGSLLKYGEPWRLGANEATEIEFFSPATIQGKKVAKGRYILYCIPQAESWIVIFNTNTDSWGLHADPAKDVHRFTIPVQKSSAAIEFFTMSFAKTESGADLIMAWDNMVARLPLQF